MTKAKISNEFYSKLKIHKKLLQVNSYFSSQSGRCWKKGLKRIFYFHSRTANEGEKLFEPMNEHRKALEFMSPLFV